ncbi:neurogenic locus notch homolog protein 1-like [Dendronephthya gigantea]|uniref:neurogenic locus notch homolog protein 1-like n=1 Tax=Dendronephthya gigantea TaxID=151771 RepID=UPI001068F151|nr:neurogenic locus notch homolog protein 1-like [Dendronephthya gigantea]
MSVFRVIICFLLLISMLCEHVTAILCHREEKFVKAEGSLPAINPIKTTTVSAEVFCSTECTNFPGCNSFTYLTETATDNCQLSASVDGESSSAKSVVYKKVPGMSITGCASSPCLNGGTCQDVCYPPYHVCDCPSDKQGDNCEWNTACVTEDWTLRFDNPGTHYCGGKNYMRGFQRSACQWLYCLDKVDCCPPQIEYSQAAQTCTNANWYSSFGSRSWNYCPRGYFVNGFIRSDGDSIVRLEEGRCCKPSNGPSDWGECFVEDIMSSFDEPWAKVGCSKPLHYIVGIYTHKCDKISCIEKLECCSIRSA